MFWAFAGATKQQQQHEQTILCGGEQCGSAVAAAHHSWESSTHMQHRHTRMHTHARNSARTYARRQAVRRDGKTSSLVLSGDTAQSDFFKSFSALRVQLVNPRPFLALLPRGLSITQPGPITDTHGDTCARNMSTHTHTHMHTSACPSCEH